MENTLRKYRAPLFADWGSDVSAALDYVAQLSSASVEGPAINTATRVVLNTVINAVDKMLASSSPEKLAILAQRENVSDNLIDDRVSAWMDSNLHDRISDELDSWADDNLSDRIESWIDDNLSDSLGDRIESWIDDNLGNKINDIDLVVRAR